MSKFGHCKKRHPPHERRSAGRQDEPNLYSFNPLYIHVNLSPHIRAVGIDYVSDKLWGEFMVVEQPVNLCA
eukprot:1962056-Pyramimonas_sp.AAC.2